MIEAIFTPADFVAVFNQTLEFAYPSVTIEGELADFRVSRNAWVYFSLKDEMASVKFFGSVHTLPGPLEDGLRLRVIGVPRLHPQFGFSITFSVIQPVGEGSIKKAADLLQSKLEAEGLFAPERKRPLPEIPQRIGLVTAAASAAAADFIKILNERWGGVEILLADVLVQGEQSPAAIVAALNHFEQMSPLADVLVVTRGGGSAEDLAAFNDERVVRSIAGSRTPTLVAIGHEIDISLAELAADVRASTPSNAAQIVVPDKKYVLSQLMDVQNIMAHQIKTQLADTLAGLKTLAGDFDDRLQNMIDDARRTASERRKLVELLNPKSALKRGYAIVRKNGRHITSVRQINSSDKLNLELGDGKITAVAK